MLTTTPNAPKFDNRGNHWQMHGNPVHHRTLGDPRAPAGQAIDVHSYFNATSSKGAAPFVLLIHQGALVPTGTQAQLDFTHLTPDDARRFAAHLVDAANMADRVLSVLLAQRSAAATSAARTA